MDKLPAGNTNLESTADSPSPRFSILIASYNRAHLLPRCLDSILGQTYAQFEAIVIDDGSTDDTAERVRAYAEKDSRFRYLYQQNQGANAARNYGSRQARGEYVLVFDSDDEARPEWLSRLNWLIAESMPVVASCGIDFFDERGTYLRSHQPPDNYGGTTSGGVYLSGTYAVKREVFLEMDGFAEHLPAHQSTEFRLRLFELCSRQNYRIASISDRLICAHSHDGPKIRRDAAAKLEATKYILAHHRDKFLSQESIASWLASAGGCAAELGRYSESRAFFGDAVLTCPRIWKNYARWMIVGVPLLRKLFWRQTGKR